MPRTARPLSLLAALLLLVPASAPAHAVPAPAQAATTPDRRPTLPRPSIVCAPHCVGGSAMSARGVVYRGSGVPAPPRVRNVSWIAVDLETGEVLAAKAPHARLLPASTLKILTALTLLPVITPEKRYRAMPSDVQAEGTRVGILPGKTYSGRDLYDALLLSSGNDAAYMLARVAGGRAKTLRAMNETARELGAFDTAAGDPSGLDAPGQRTSVYDLALITRAAMRSPRFRAHVARRTARFPGGPGKGGRRERFTISNHNPMLWNYAGTYGVKNGYTTAAQHSLVTVVRRGGRSILVAQLHGLEGGWRPAARLHTWAARYAGRLQPVGTLVAPGTPDPAAPAPGPTTRASRAGRPAAAPVGGHTGVVAADRPPTGWRDPVVRSFAWLGGVALLGVVLAGAALERGRRTDRRARG